MATVTGITFNPTSAPRGSAPVAGTVAFTAAAGRTFNVGLQIDGGPVVTVPYPESAEVVRFVLGPPTQPGDIGLTVDGGATLTLGGTPGTFTLNRPA